MDTKIIAQRLPTLRDADQAIEFYRSWQNGNKLDPSYDHTARKRCLQTIDAFDRLSLTPPTTMIAREVGKLLMSKPSAGVVSDGFVSLLVEDLLDQIPEVSTMAILIGFKKLRLNETDFVPSTGKIVSEIMKAEVEFRGARHNLIGVAQAFYDVALDRIVPPRDPQRFLSKWTDEDDEEAIIEEETRKIAKRVAEGDTDGDLPD
jgi:hypothetical protein